MTWKEAKTPKEKREALEAAFWAHGENVAIAAKALGMSRMHFYRSYRALTGYVTPRDAVTTGDTHTSDTRRDGVTARGNRMSVTPNSIEPLTYEDAVRTFEPVNTATQEAAAEPKEAPKEPTNREGYDLPISIIDWLDEEALLRKRSLRGGKAAKGPIVVAAIRHYRAWLEAERAAGRTGFEAEKKGGSK